MTYNFLETLYDDLMTISKTLVVKRTDLARKYETTQTAKAFELYLACVNGSRYFYNFASFDSDILAKYVSPDILGACIRNPEQIPNNVRELVVEEQSVRVIDTYDEQNNYYRMLMGLPQVDDTQWFYITGYDDIPDDVPLHKLSMEQIAQLEIRGNLDYIKSAYTDDKYKYVNYLGVNSIDLIQARLAKPFDIIRIDTPATSNTKEMFTREYYGARRYIMALMYNDKLFAMKELYDPIIGIIILCLAIRNTLVPTEAEYLNFVEILDAILESYGLLKYFERLPFTYKKRLVLALDHLLAVKGTDGVLLDLCEIFSYNNMTANRYHLLKTQPKDIEGNIIFSDDNDKAYDLGFVKADIRDREIDYSEENIISYESIINNDYLWQLTPEELSKLKAEDFNTYMSKYIDIEAAYDLSELTFEVCYFVNLLLDSRQNLMKVRCTNMYSTVGYSNCYTMVVFMLAALAYRSGFDGNIVYEPLDIAQILKFNLNDIGDVLKEVVAKYELLVDVSTPILGEHSVTLDKPTGYVNETEMIEIYIKNRELYEAIVKEMNSTDDYRKYVTLSNAKELMFVSTMERSSFKKSNGESAATYMEMLRDIEPRLAAKIESCDSDAEINNLILYILEKLEELFNSDELKYLFLNTPNATGSLISRYLIQAINVFKASSVQLQSLNAFFYMGDNNPVRWLDHTHSDEIRYTNDEIWIKDELAIHETIMLNDYVNVADKSYTNIE